jgi:nicotinamide-nucleotide amidase
MQSRRQLMQVKNFRLRYNAGMGKDSKAIVQQLATRLLKLTDLAGSSDWFERGFVTYSNQAKNEMLAVPASVIEDYGAVSEPVAAAMAIGALRHSHADFSVAVTGVAGPAGGSEEKPVGTVWIAVASADEVIANRFQFNGDREAVREATLVAALEALIDLVDSD